MPYHIYPCGDHAVTVELGNAIDEEINRKVLCLYHHFTEQRINGVKDIIPAYHSLTLVYDIAAVRKMNPGQTAYEAMGEQLVRACENTEWNKTLSSRRISIPVCYDTAVAPDIETLAAAHELSAEEVIHLHTQKTYRVYMLGFLPGFAYMGTVDERIITPRKSSPRTKVPAGSVGIAGQQTGIYPFDSPGGWQLIGRTPVKMFDASKTSPCYLQPGDEVSFYPITLKEMEEQAI